MQDIKSLVESSTPFLIDVKDNRGPDSLIYYFIQQLGLLGASLSKDVASLPLHHSENLCENCEYLGFTSTRQVVMLGRVSPKWLEEFPVFSTPEARVYFNSLEESSLLYKLVYGIPFYFKTRGMSFTEILDFLETVEKFGVYLHPTALRRLREGAYKHDGEYGNSNRIVLINSNYLQLCHTEAEAREKIFSYYDTELEYKQDSIKSVLNDNNIIIKEGLSSYYCGTLISTKYVSINKVSDLVEKILKLGVKIDYKLGIEETSYKVLKSLLNVYSYMGVIKREGDYYLTFINSGDDLPKYKIVDVDHLEMVLGFVE